MTVEPASASPVLQGGDSEQTMQIAIKLRIRDKHEVELRRQARAVNFVWNYCNETQKKAARDGRKWLSAFDLQKLTAGSSKELNIHAHTIKRVCDVYCDSRKANKKAWLRWRSKRSLGWVPFNTGHVAFEGSGFKFRGVKYETMHLRDELKPGIKIGAGSFNQDSRGRWYTRRAYLVCIASLSGISERSRAGPGRAMSRLVPGPIDVVATRLRAR